MVMAFRKLTGKYSLRVQAVKASCRVIYVLSLKKRLTWYTMLADFKFQIIYSS